MNGSDPFLLVALVCGLAAAAMLAWALMERRRAGAADARLWELNDRLVEAEARARHAEGENAANGERLRAHAVEQAQAVADQLVKRATESFQAQDRLNQAKLEAQLKPVAETLEKFAAQVSLVEQQRAAEQGGLKAQIEALMQASIATQDEAKKLSAALRRAPGVQGRWGEQMLRNVLEMAGLRAGVDFEEQVHAAGEDGARRPDVVVRLPGGGMFVVDSKVSLNDYLASLEATDDLAREAAVKAHVEAMRRHVQQLSSRAYWAQFDKPPVSRSPDIVVMFVPLESAFASVVERHPTLVAEAWERRVAIVTPTAMFPLLRAVAYGWRAEDQAANAREIVEAGRELHKRVGVIARYAFELGGALDRAVERYNDFAGSLERNVLTQARRFEAMSAAQADKPIAEAPVLDAHTRPLVKLAAEPRADEKPTLTVGIG